MRQDHIDGEVRCPVEALTHGQRVDLQGDKFADTGAYPQFEFEFEVVAALERETADCVRVDFESGFSCGFPPEHLVKVDGEQTAA